MRFSILTVVLCLTLSALPAQAQQTPQAFNGGIRMGTSYCVGYNFDCGELNYISDDIVAAANQCIRTSFGIEQQIMAHWTDQRGEFENCVLPGELATNAQGAAAWAVCCIKKREGDVCDLVCTRYIGRGQQ